MECVRQGDIGCCKTGVYIMAMFVKVTVVHVCWVWALDARVSKIEALVEEMGGNDATGKRRYSDYRVAIQQMR